jgi:geranylgeranyl diphosphate synthase type I
MMTMGYPRGILSDEPGRNRTWTREADRILAEAREIVEPAHRSAVDALPAALRHVAGYHAGWWDADGRPAGSAGKAVRPALTLACARAASGADGAGSASGAAAAVAAAVAVELVHDFSLLHDDVMDEDLTRRHRPASWAVFGVNQAILAGDAMLAAAVRQLAGTQDREGDPSAAGILAAAVLELCEGQSADLAFERRSEITIGECLAMAERKTGALLGVACQLGATAAGAGRRAAGRYRAFGRQLGLAFQLTDDLLGIWGNPELTGKPAGSDLASRKKSLPVVAALSAGTTASDKLARLYGRREKLDERAITQATQLIEAAGGRTWAQDEARRRINAALKALADARPDPDGAADLAALARLMTRRDH